MCVYFRKFRGSPRRRTDILFSLAAANLIQHSAFFSSQVCNNLLFSTFLSLFLEFICYILNARLPKLKPFFLNIIKKIILVVPKILCYKMFYISLAFLFTYVVIPAPRILIAISCLVQRCFRFGLLILMILEDNVVKESNTNKIKENLLNKKTKLLINKH